MNEILIGIVILLSIPAVLLLLLAKELEKNVKDTTFDRIDAYLGIEKPKPSFFDYKFSKYAVYCLIFVLVCLFFIGCFDISIIGGLI